MPVELPAGVQLPAGVDATVNSLTVAAGEPGIDTATAGVLELGGDNATTVEIGKGNVVVDASGNVAGRSFTASSSSPYAAWPGAAAGSFNAILFCPPPTGINDTTNIQTQLTAAKNAGGGLVVITGLPSSVYLISTPLVIGSNTYLWITEGITIRLISGSNCNMLNNTAVSTSVRSVADAVSTATSTTITSATAAFTAADTGRAFTLSAAGDNGCPFAGRLTYVNATTCTTSQAAIASNSGQTLTIYNVDQNITIDGGIWDRQDNSSGSTNQSNSCHFRRVDGFMFKNASAQGTQGKYAFAIGDTLEATFRDLTNLAHQPSDGIHVNGPAKNILIENIQGTTGDDLVAFTPENWTNFNDVTGDISSVKVANLFDVNGAKQILALYPSPGYTISGVDVQGIYGTCQAYCVWLSTINGAVPQGRVGGTLDDIDVQGVHATGGNLFGPVSVNTPTTNGGSGLLHGTFRDIALDVTQYAAGVAAVSVNGTSVVSSLTIEDVEFVKTTATTGIVICKLVAASVVTDLSIKGVYGTFPPSAIVLSMTDATANVITRATLSDLHLAGNNTGALVQTAAGTTLGALSISASTTTGTAYVANLASGGVIDVMFAGSSFTTNNGIFNNVASSIKVHSGGCSFPGSTGVGTGTGSIRCYSPEFPIDTSQAYVAKNAGDMAFHTSAANTPYKVGPVVCDGTAWAPFQETPSQSPTEAVLVSGVSANLGALINVTLSAARVVGAPLLPRTGQRLVFSLIQGGAGAWAVTWNAVFKKTWADTGNATGARSSIAFIYDGTNWNQDGAQSPYV